MTADEIKRSEKAGLPPGTLMYVGDKPVERSRISVIDYDEENFLEKEVKAVEECFPFKDTATVTWINVDGVRDADVIGQLGARFDIHPLILEDIMTTTQRPKVEDLGQAIYVVLRMIECGAEGKDMRAHQLSLIIGPNLVLSFQETPRDCLGPVRERIRGGKGRNQPGGALDLAHLGTADVERIEAVRGAASVLYGSDAVTGVIQVFTRRGGEGGRLSLLARGGSLGSSDLRARVAGGTTRLGWSAGASRFGSDGSYAFNSGYENWDEIGVLDQQGEYQRIGYTFDEMGFDALDERNETRILGPFGVPPNLIGSRIGLSRSTSSNYDQAYDAFWNDTMLNEAKLLEDDYQYYLNDGNKFVAFDFSDVPAFQEDVPAIVQAWRGLVKYGIPKNMAADIIGLQIGDLADGDVQYMPLSLVPIEDAQAQRRAAGRL